MQVKLAIIGGSGLQEIFPKVEAIKVSTPFGSPSGEIEVGNLDKMNVAFLRRHGKGHVIPPHRVNYRANIWALKHIGVERLISVSAVGSLKEDYKPGELVVVDQYIDFTKKRDYTFYDGGKVIHISTADPFCHELSGLFIKEAKSLNIPIHEKGTYVCIEGPRFSTRAESRMFRNFADIIGMTLVPEVQLAREQEICYVTLAMVTDYDVWAEKPVNVEEVIATMNRNIGNVKRLVKSAIPKISKERKCSCKDALKGADV